MLFLCCTAKNCKGVFHIQRRGICWKAPVMAALLITIAVFSADNCVAAQKGEEILISAAISLKDAFQEIGAIFEMQTGMRVRYNLGASGLLQKQIEAGAPVDVFASAGDKQMDELQTKGLIIPGTRRNLAGNALVLVIPTSSKIPIRSFADLARPDVTRAAIGNPKTVPAGQYARETLENLNVWDKLQPRLVLAENVRQVLDYVERGEVDAGIVYASDMDEAHGKAIVAANAPKGSHSPILYPVAVVKDAENINGAQRFIDLALSSAGQVVLKKHGFLSPQ
jgi:molybdate transport system substrate-binding protein